MKNAGKIRTFLWILIFAANAALPGLSASAALIGVVLLYASVPDYPKCITAPRFWIIVLFPVLIGLTVPPVTVREGIIFAVKACVFLTLIEFLRRRISPRRAAGYLEKKGLGGLGFAFTVAMNTLASAGEKVRVVWSTVRMRGGFRKGVLTGIRTFTESVIFAVLLQGEQIYLAARAKGYAGDDT